MANEQSAVRERTNIDTNIPRKYKVIVYNDDTTTMDFVVYVLNVVFFKTNQEARQIMLTAHGSGSAVVGVYSYDIAISKVRKATDMARDEGFPLHLEYEPE